MMRAPLRSVLIALSLTSVTLILVLSYSQQAQRLIPSSLQQYLPRPSQKPLPKPTSEAEHLDPIANAPSAQPHPIGALIKAAQESDQEKLKSRSYDLATAGIRYRKRRNRHPPPGFDKWYEYALAHDAVVVEEYFDRIYADIQPFWGLDPETTSEAAANWHHVVSVRNGTAIPQGDVKGRVPWLKLWTDLVAECAEFLPDVDMPINYMDEPRLLVPWTEIDRLVKIAQEKEKIIPIQDAIQTYQTAVRRASNEEQEAKGHRPHWITNADTPYWDIFAETCSPASPSHGVPAIKDFNVPPEFPTTPAAYSQEGYVKNASASADACEQPHLQGLHATLIEPITISTSKELFPLFGGSKLVTNNEILIPGAMYLTDDPFYSGGEEYGPPWDQKTDTLTWRGDATGGRHKVDNWRHFQRLRVIEMLNGTRFTEIQKSSASPMTFRMPSKEQYPSALSDPGKMGTWLKDHADAGFVHLACHPKYDCGYLSDYFHELPSKPMKDQYISKFFVDVDGNSFSARYRALLLSTSLPIKSTIYAEWHDDRLQPWLHYAPMDNTFQDLYGILDFFTRDEKGDAAARFIAESGKAWAEKVLRREDMLLYVWRLLLEWARVCDGNRERLGFVDDLLGGGG